MTDEREDYIKYRLERAHEALVVAEIIWKTGLITKEQGAFYIEHSPVS